MTEIVLLCGTGAVALGFLLGRLGLLDMLAQIATAGAAALAVQAGRASGWLPFGAVDTTSVSEEALLYLVVVVLALLGWRLGRRMPDGPQ